MFRRTVMTFAFCLLGLAAVASAQPPVHPDYDFLFHKSALHDREVVQTASRLFLAVPPQGWATPAEFRQASLLAAEGWLGRHGYLTEGAGLAVDLFTDENGNDSLVIAGTNIRIYVFLPVGPFQTHLRERLITTTIIRMLPQAPNGL
jgi:hypothetical protein